MSGEAPPAAPASVRGVAHHVVSSVVYCRATLVSVDVRIVRSYAKSFAQREAAAHAVPVTQHRRAYSRGSGGGLDHSISPSTVMSSIDDDSTATPATSAKSIPVHLDMQPIKHDGNDATIEGTLSQVHKFVKRTGTHALTFAHRSSRSHGKIYVPDVPTIEAHANC